MYLIRSVRIGRKNEKKKKFATEYLEVSFWYVYVPGALKAWTEVPSFGVDNFHNDDFLYSKIVASSMTFGNDKKLGVARTLGVTHAR